LGKEAFGSWKETTEMRLERMQSRITQLFQYSSTVPPARDTRSGAAADASISCATIKLEEKTRLEFRKPKKKVDCTNFLAIVKLLRAALATGDADLDTEVVEYEGWKG
jgi:hypothetical protein